MKKILLNGLFLGLATGAFAQGQVNIRNVFNTDASPNATTNGLVLLSSGASTAPITTDFNFVFYGGSDANSLTALASFIGANAAGDNAAGPGTFFEPNIATVAGATATGFFRIDAWTGSASDFASATVKGTTGVFSNPLGNPNASPPGTPAELTGMPALVISSAVPEPSTFALAGLGAAALLIFRRRK